MTITGPFSFTAHWKRSATVDLQLEGGLWTSETPVTSYTVTKNTSPLEDVEHITLPGLADVTRDGWRFDGWALTPGGTVLYAPGATITAPDVNMTLHARWTARLYTVAYETGDGTYIRTRTDVTWDSTDVVPAPATRVGYVFLGWHTDATIDEENWREDQLGRGLAFAAIAKLLGADDTITRVTLYAWFTPERAELHYAVGTGQRLGQP